MSLALVRCSQCGAVGASFSKSQLRRAPEIRRCRTCIVARSEGSGGGGASGSLAPPPPPPPPLPTVRASPYAAPARCSGGDFDDDEMSFGSPYLYGGGGDEDDFGDSGAGDDYDGFGSGGGGGSHADELMREVQALCRGGDTADATALLHALIGGGKGGGGGGAGARAGAGGKAPARRALPAFPPGALLLAPSAGRCAAWPAGTGSCSSGDQEFPSYDTCYCGAWNFSLPPSPARAAALLARWWPFERPVFARGAYARHGGGDYTASGPRRADLANDSERCAGGRMRFRGRGGGGLPLTLSCDICCRAMADAEMRAWFHASVRLEPQLPPLVAAAAAGSVPWIKARGS